MVAILFNIAEPFEQIDNTLRQKAHVKSGENWSEKKIFKYFMILTCI